MKLIVGLGNPGEKYAKTRHNVGYMVVDKLASSVKGIASSWEYKEKFKAEIFDYTLYAKRYMLIKPLTYMNNSGLSVALLADYFNIPHEDIIIVHDELDLPLGKIKIRLGGAAAGHHGVESVIASLKDDQFIRLRLGIGNLRTQSAEHDGAHVNVDQYVTSLFRSDENSKLKHMIKQSVDALDVLIDKGIEVAQNQFH